MKFIKPSEISSKVMTLIEESDEFVVLVSPYVKISKWYKLVKKLETLKSRQIPLQFIIRDDRGNANSFSELKDLGINYKAIPDLHAKLYINEKYAIVSSMNLLLSYEINSLELAYKTETKEEYDELKEFCERHLNISFSPKEKKQAIFKTKKKEVTKLVSKIPNGVDWRQYVMETLRKGNSTYMEGCMEDGKFMIKYGSNKYEAFIANAKSNTLRMNAILTKSEYDELGSVGGLPFDNQSIIPEMYAGRNGNYNMLWASLDVSLLTNNFDYTYKKDQDAIADAIIEFVSTVAKFKYDFNNW